MNRLSRRTTTGLKMTAAGFAALFLAFDPAGMAQEKKDDKKPVRPDLEKPEAEKKKRTVESKKKESRVRVEVKPAPKPKPVPQKAEEEKKRPGVSVLPGKRPARIVVRSADERGFKLRPWMGVATHEVPDSLRNHLELADGFGIQVDLVAEGSPAAEAGLKKNDILTKLDDQLLITPEHLAVLVRSKKKGDKVSVHLIRKGREETAEITLAEKELPDWQPARPRMLGFHSGPRSGDPRGYEFELRGHVPKLDLNHEDIQRSIRQYQDQLKEWSQKLNPPRPPVPAKPAVRPGGGSPKPPAISVRPGFPISVFGGSGTVRIDNQHGEVSIEVKDGKHTISIRNDDGETVYEGPYDPKKGTEGLPEEAKKQLDEMKLNDLKLISPPSMKKPIEPKSGKGPEKNKGKLL